MGVTILIFPTLNMWESTTTFDSPRVWPEETRNDRFNGLGLNIYFRDLTRLRM